MKRTTIEKKNEPDKQPADMWEDKVFANEMDKRTLEYETGKAKLYKFEYMKKAAIAEYKSKKP